MWPSWTVCTCHVRVYKLCKYVNINARENVLSHNTLTENSFSILDQHSDGAFADGAVFPFPFGFFVFRERFFFCFLLLSRSVSMVRAGVCVSPFATCDSNGHRTCEIFIYCLPCAEMQMGKICRRQPSSSHTRRRTHRMNIQEENGKAPETIARLTQESSVHSYICAFASAR